MNQKKFEERLAVFSIIAIPILTLFMSFDKSPFRYTLSMVGNWFGFDYRLEFIIWGTLTAIFLMIFLKHLYKKTHFKNKKARWMLYFAILFLLLTVLIPTLIRTPIPMSSRHFEITYHEIFAFLFTLSLIISLYLFSVYLSKHNLELSKDTKIYWTVTIGGSLLFLTIFGMTEIFEIFFFISLSIFLLLIDKKIRKVHFRKKRLRRKANSPARI